MTQTKPQHAASLFPQPKITGSLPSIHFASENPLEHLILLRSILFSFLANQHQSIISSLANSSFFYALAHLAKHQRPSASGITMAAEDGAMEKFLALLKQQKAMLKGAQAYKGQKPLASMKRSRSVLQREFYGMVWHPFSLTILDKNTHILIVLGFGIRHA